MNQEICNNIYTILGSTGVCILLVISEILPFIKQVKSNGIIHSLIEIIRKNNYERLNSIESDVETDP